MDRKYSDPTRYENSIDADDSPYGADGGYTRHGNFIPADAMRELVSLREITERQAAELERLRADARLLYLALNSRLPRPMCRDCADSDGTCANNGAEPCDPKAAEEWARTVRDDYARKMADPASGE